MFRVLLPGLYLGHVDGRVDQAEVGGVPIYKSAQEHHARELAAFVEPLRKRVPRLVVDLIPYNPVPGDVFERPGRAAVSAFQQELKRRDPTLFVGVRNARGDDEMAACGQLATSTSKS